MRPPDMTYAFRAMTQCRVNITRRNTTQVTAFSTTTKASWSLQAATRLRHPLLRPWGNPSSQSLAGLGSNYQVAMSTKTSTSDDDDTAQFVDPALDRVLAGLKKKKERQREKETPEPWQFDNIDDILLNNTLPLSLDFPKSRYLRPHKPYYKLPRIMMRDACLCERCVDPSSGQKRFSTCDIPDELSIAEARKTEDGSLEIKWKDDFFTHDHHVSVYPPWQIEPYRRGKPIEEDSNERKEIIELWDKDTMEKSALFINYHSFMKGGSELYAAFSRLLSHGIFFLRDVPHEQQAVEGIASKLGIIQETFYGRTWDVISKPNAENVAYTSSYLGLHADLLYMNDPPRIQLLHCLKNTCGGGESIFSDGLRASKQLQQNDPKAWSTLTHCYVHYWYTKGVHQRSKYRPIICHDDIYWSPPFQNPTQFRNMRLRIDDVYDDWISAARKFKELLDADRYQYQYKMKEGECVVFNNLRTLHGRREFDTSSGERWLKGTYVGSESYEDKIREFFFKLRNPGKKPLKTQAAILNRTDDLGSE